MNIVSCHEVSVGRVLGQSTNEWYSDQNYDGFATLTATLPPSECRRHYIAFCGLDEQNSDNFSIDLVKITLAPSLP